MEKLIIAGKEFNSRLFLGTGKFNSNELMEQAILASETEMVTVAMKRIELGDKEDDMLKHIIHIVLMLIVSITLSMLLIRLALIFGLLINLDLLWMSLKIKAKMNFK